MLSKTIISALTLSSFVSSEELHCNGLCQRSHAPNDVPVMVKMEAMEKKIKFWEQAKMVKK